MRRVLFVALTLLAGCGDAQPHPRRVVAPAKAIDPQYARAMVRAILSTRFHGQAAQIEKTLEAIPTTDRIKLARLWNQVAQSNTRLTLEQTNEITRLIGPDVAGMTNQQIDSLSELAAELVILNPSRDMPNVVVGARTIYAGFRRNGREPDAAYIRGLWRLLDAKAGDDTIFAVALAAADKGLSGDQVEALGDSVLAGEITPAQMLAAIEAR